MTFISGRVYNEPCKDCMTTFFLFEEDENYFLNGRQLFGMCTPLLPNCHIIVFEKNCSTLDLSLFNEILSVVEFHQFRVNIYPFLSCISLNFPRKRFSFSYVITHSIAPGCIRRHFAVRVRLSEACW